MRAGAARAIIAAACALSACAHAALPDVSQPRLDRDAVDVLTVVLRDVISPRIAASAPPTGAIWLTTPTREMPLWSQSLQPDGTPRAHRLYEDMDRALLSEDEAAAWLRDNGRPRDIPPLAVPGVV